MPMVVPASMFASNVPPYNCPYLLNNPNFFVSIKFMKLPFENSEESKTIVATSTEGFADTATTNDRQLKRLFEVGYSLPKNTLHRA